MLSTSSLVEINRYAARSSRMRRRSAAGGSPAAAETSRSKWKRETCSRAASASPDASRSSSVSARTSTKRAKVSVATLTCRIVPARAAPDLIGVALFAVRLGRVRHEQAQPRVVLVELTQTTVARIPRPVPQIALHGRDGAADDLRG